MYKVEKAAGVERTLRLIIPVSMCSFYCVYQCTALAGVSPQGGSFFFAEIVHPGGKSTIPGGSFSFSQLPRGGSLPRGVYTD